MSEALLELRNVVAYYGDFQALFGISFQVRPQEVLALLGGNGAGKTTCLRVISGLLRPRSGTVHFEGQDITRTAPDSIVDLGIAHVPEGRQLFPEMTVEENLYLGSQLPRARAHRPQNLERFPPADRSISLSESQGWLPEPRTAEALRAQGMPPGCRGRRSDGTPRPPSPACRAR